MNYLFYGIERLVINNEIASLEKKYNLDKLNISRYDFDKELVDKIINDCETYSLFDDKKMVIVDNATFFKNAKDDDEKFDSTKLENYLKNPNPNTILIFIVNSESINKNKKTAKALLEHGKIFEYNKTGKVDIAKKQLEGYKIDPKTFNYLLSRVGDDIGILYQEIEKLKTYKTDDVITIDDIDNVVIKTINLNFFDFVENIINKNKEEALEQYHELLKRGEPPIKIIVTLSRQIRMMFQAKKLREKGYTADGIASMLGEKPFFVSQCLKKSYNFDEEYLYKKLELLADLDINIKTGKIDDKLGLELFIINQ